MNRLGKLVLTVGWAVAGVGLAVAGDDDAIKKAMKEREGSWKVVSRVADGMKASDEEVKGVRVVTKGDKFTISRDKEVLAEGTYKIVALDKNVRKVDVTATKGKNAGKISKQIYKIEGDTMTVCTAPAEKDRPTEFESKPGTGHILTVLKRENP